jgi:hypothetical protein
MGLFKTFTLIGDFPLPLWERKKNHWVDGAIATLNPLIFQVRGEFRGYAPLTSKI